MAFGIGTSRRPRGATRRADTRLLVTAVSLALLVPVGLAPVAEAAGDSGGPGRPELPEQRVSKVLEAGPGAKKTRERVAKQKAANAERARKARSEQRAADWPEAGEATLALDAKNPGKKPATVSPGGMPVDVTPARTKKTAAADGSARVTVLDRKAAEKAGITGVLLTAEAESQGRAEVSVDYGDFAGAIGGGWAGRLRLVRLPACVLTTPEKPECREQTPLASRNDLDAQTVTAPVTLAEATTESGTETGTGSGMAAQLAAATSASSSSATVLAVTAAAAGSGESPAGTGDYSATELSASSAWEAGGSSGSFTWSYDFTMPPAAAGPTPGLSLSYDSGSVDGRTATTNNQGTSVGEGFTVTESYIERSYGSCDDDGHADVFDSCWKYDNARLVLNGKSTRLVKDNDSGQWHLQDDDASTVTRSTDGSNADNDNEYWTVVTGDGTKYVFGLAKLPGAGSERTNSVWTVPVFGDDPGEPGYGNAGSFGGRAVTQAWRWNLDYVEDTRGNASTYWYAKDTNHYKKNKATTANADYTRGGYLKEIKYGLRKGALFTDDADARVTFSYAERCTVSNCSELTKDTAKNWPDVPFDAICSSGDDECDSSGPAFFSRKRLTGINTFSWSAAGGAYQPVDSWALTQQYLDGGDIGDTSDHVLALKSLKRTGKAGDTNIALNPVSFTYQMRPNRVDATDNILPLTRPRISTITSETGAVTDVTLSSPECVRSVVIDAPEDTNTRSCYPQYWHINGSSEASVDWFHKYRVLAVLSDDSTTNNEAVEHAYTYSGAAWHHSDDPFTPKEERTWSDWRGYRKVTVHKGAKDVTRSRTVSLYLQGMNGDKKADGTTKSVTVAPLLDTDVDFAAVTDTNRYRGLLRQQVTYNGSQAISSTFKNYNSYRQTATQTVPGAADHAARWVRNSSSYTSTYLTASGTWRTHATSSTYDSLGMVTTHTDSGQWGLGGDETCTRTWYARNGAAGITSLVSRTRTVARQCSVAETSLNLPASQSSRGDVLADTAVVYDSATATGWNASQSPTKGEATWTGRATGYPATTTGGERHPTGWQTTTTSTYDTLGRPLSVTDTDGNSTSTAYTPAAAGPLTRTLTTDPKGHRAVSFLDPRRGQVLREYDINSKKTELAHDALGRLTKVWLPNRNRAAGDTPSSKFAYHLSNTKPSWVSTATPKKDGEIYNTTYELYDGLLRPIQTQSPTPQGGQLLTDVRYDTRGLAYATFADIFDQDHTPDGTYRQAPDGEAPVQTETAYDGAGRATTSTLYVYGQKKWSTTTSYTGDSTATTAVKGGTAARAITDVRGRTVETREYAGSSPADAGYGAGTGLSYASVKHEYGLDGQPSAVTGPDNAKWTYTYDLFGRQTRTTDPDKGTSTTEYNKLDQVVKSTDSRGESIVSAYDVLGRVTGTWSGSRSDANQLTGYSYDTVLKGLAASSTRYVGGKTGQAYTRSVTDYDNLSRPVATELELPADDPLVKAGAPATLEYATHYNLDGTRQFIEEPALGGLP
ncbi:RHS repeat-associated core domain-containing protein, partial [Streptomyces sp. NPDC002845]